jgi:O-acetyl-ADP-ribose deacetylase (regulator of RNase III)
MSHRSLSGRIGTTDMLEIAKGNLLKADVDALVNTVNTEGVMGKGIALQFKQAYPEMCRAYERACQSNQVKLGTMDVHDLGGLAAGPRWIINFPTKGHWRAKSRLKDIESGLVDLVATVKRLGIGSIALPPLGCGYGGLPWEAVHPLIESAFSALDEVHVLLYAPTGVPEASGMPNRTRKPALTSGQAALVMLIERYLQGMLDPIVSLLEVHKLMYFLQEAGEPLKLKYTKGTYGPYAQNLRHVLTRMEQHYTSGYGDGEDAPTKPISLVDDAADQARAAIENDAPLHERMERVAALIDGFEDSFGLELLSSVHWMARQQQVATSPDEVIAMVHGWSDRKRKLMKPEHLRAAWNRLEEQGWLSSGAAHS